jgi:predicted SprT family Zn-dependent metalloprotease
MNNDKVYITCDLCRKKKTQVTAIELDNKDHIVACHSCYKKLLSINIEKFYEKK